VPGHGYAGRVSPGVFATNPLSVYPVDVVELTEDLYFLRFPVGHAYLYRDPDGLTLIDTGLPGSAPLIAGAIRAIGHEPGSVRRLVLTHFHADRAQATASFHRLAALDAEIACFGHGEPLTAGAATELRAAGRLLPGLPN
jgi:glyoxylase-like metal-dependent hydrolase (beta-lactamase superfamily II)